MIIDGTEYDDEEWRIARVHNVRISGDEHHTVTKHHGEMRDKVYVCEDCMSVYFDGKSEVSEAVHSEVRVDERFLDRLVELGVEYAEDLGAFQEFLKKIIQAYGLSYSIPDVKAMRDELREALEIRKTFEGNAGKK